MSSAINSKPSVWVLTNAPSPYQVELFTAIDAERRIELEVCFLRDAAVPGPERRFPHRICRSWLTLSSGDELRVHGRAILEATFGQYDLFILSGLYTSITFLTCAWILYCRGKKWAIWWERPHATKEQERRFPASVIHVMKDSIRLWLLRTADLVIGIGTAAVNEYQAMGVRPDRLRMLPYCCDVTRFTQVPQATRDHVRRQLGWQSHLVYLFSGQMIPRKGVDILLQAFFQLAEIHPDVALLLLGEGIDRPRLQAMVPESLRTRVRFQGQIPQSQLPDQFAAADVFAFPSRHDGWAVVLNEACGARLPIIATHQTGAAHDLIQEGVNGFRIQADDVHGMLIAMSWFATHRNEITTMGQHSLELVQPFNATEGARKFAGNVSYCLNH